MISTIPQVQRNRERVEGDKRKGIPARRNSLCKGSEE